MPAAVKSRDVCLAENPAGLNFGERNLVSQVQ
jgi:hypothetical protein